MRHCDRETQGMGAGESVCGERGGGEVGGCSGLVGGGGKEEVLVVGGGEGG